MYSEFKDKVVLVTGGSTGIGKSTAFAFAKYGAEVVICSRREELGKIAIQEAAEQNLNIDFLKCDVAVHEEVEVLIQHIIKRYGQLDIAFNNAGIDGNRAITHEADISLWKNMININLNGVFYCMKYELSEMVRRNSGCIVNNASVSGHRGYPGLPSYIASKHGVIGLTKASAMEYASKGIRINSISAGIIETPMIPKEKLNDPEFQKWVKTIEPMQRTASPKEVANAVLWLCSTQASYTTGHDLAVDGGILAK